MKVWVVMGVIDRTSAFEVMGVFGSKMAAERCAGVAESRGYWYAKIEEAHIYTDAEAREVFV